MKQYHLFFLTISIILFAILGLTFIHERHPEAQTAITKNHHFIIVVCSYNNKDVAQKNLDSIFDQQYKNFHVVYLDDHSPDGTYEVAKKYIKEHNLSDKITLISNPVNTRQLRNTYHAVHTYSKDDDIIVILDGDDWFAHDKVLTVLNTVYQDSNVWITYGNYIRDHGWLFLPGYYKPHTYDTATMRKEHDVPPPHLRTFYSWLFKPIPLHDLLKEGAFLPMAADMSYMFPMIEMARDHHRPIQQTLYIYNTYNPLNCYKKNVSLQRACAATIRSRKPYKALLKQPIEQDKKIALRIIPEKEKRLLSSEDLQRFSQLLQKTKATLLTLVTKTKELDRKPQHSTYLYDNMWTYQLGWQPELPFEYQVIAHIVPIAAKEKLTQLLQESLEKLPITEEKQMQNTTGILAIIPVEGFV